MIKSQLCRTTVEPPSKQRRTTSVPQNDPIFKISASPSYPISTATPRPIDPTRIDNNTAAQKMMRNGQVYILRNGKTYTPTGVEVK